MKCPNCKQDRNIIERPGTVIHNARVKIVGYSIRCNHCGFEGKPSKFIKIAEILFGLGFEYPYSGPKAIWNGLA